MTIETERNSGTGMRINDAHLHFGRDEHHGPDGGLQHFLSQMDAHRISRACVVTPSNRAGDNSITAAALAAHPDRFVGIARLRVDATVAELEALLDQGFAGMRFMPTGDPEWLDYAHTTALTDALVRHGAVACLHAAAPDLAAATRYARRHPGLTVLFDHGGRPDLSDPHRFDPHLDQLAALPNTRIKMPNAPHHSTQPPPHRDLIPYTHHVVELFGAERVMWGSDWPGSGDDLSTALTAITTALESVSADERALVLGGTFDRTFPSTPQQKGDS